MTEHSPKPGLVSSLLRSAQVGQRERCAAGSHIELLPIPSQPLPIPGIRCRPRSDSLVSTTTVGPVGSQKETSAFLLLVS